MIVFRQAVTLEKLINDHIQASFENRSYRILGHMQAVRKKEKRTIPSNLLAFSKKLEDGVSAV